MIRIGFRVPAPPEGPPPGFPGDCLFWVAAAISNVLRVVETTAKAHAPVRTGRLRDSIRAYLAGPLDGVLEASAPHAAYLHFGTGVHGPKGRPYPIRPRRGKALFWPGAAHPVKAVLHTGIKPRDFLRRAVNDALIAGAFIEGLDSWRFSS